MTEWARARVRDTSRHRNGRPTPCTQETSCLGRLAHCTGRGPRRQRTGMPSRGCHSRVTARPTAEARAKPKPTAEARAKPKPTAEARAKPKTTAEVTATKTGAGVRWEPAMVRRGQRDTSGPLSDQPTSCMQEMSCPGKQAHCTRRGPCRRCTSTQLLGFRSLWQVLAAVTARRPGIAWRWVGISRHQIAPPTAGRTRTAGSEQVQPDRHGRSPESSCPCSTSQTQGTSRPPRRRRLRPLL
jgi:hypothetical protein